VLFTKKRALALSALLSIRLSLHQALAATNDDDARRALAKPDAVNAMCKLLRAVKNDRIGTSMMDINVCGAVAPYNELLGGKLVAMLMTSPEVVREYKKRYDGSESVIASRMAGRPITKSADLVLLTTSGIYPGRSSQYNRIRIPAERVTGRIGEIKFEESGATEAYSTIHLSTETVSLLQEAFEKENHYRHVTGKFGEGVSPRLRKVRQQFDNMGLDSDELLRTGHSRTQYMIQLARNSSDFLMGRSDDPDFILGGNGTPEETEAIAEYWRQRWLSKRIADPKILSKLRQHSAMFPSLHGANVRMPHAGQEELFEDDEYIWEVNDEQEI
jgi:hypothetical protein